MGTPLNRGSEANARPADEPSAVGGPAAPPPSTVQPAGGAPLPAPAPASAPAVTRRLRLRVVVAIIAIAMAAGGGAYYWWKQSQAQLPAGIVAGNGRIEADQIDISPKFAGRLAELLVTEGDMVTAGQVVARMDIKDLEASLKRAQAHVLQAQRTVEEARATLDQQQTQVDLAQQQLERTRYLRQRGNATQELLDQREQQLNSATALLHAATARVAQAEYALAAAEHDVELLRVNIADNTLVAPRDGRIQYRIANIGEVLPAGGKVVTMIDIASVYMDIYLPTPEAGRVKIGDDARIVLDAYPNIALPAKVSFIATQSQFTPKTVETKTERERLMFRIRVRIDADLLRAKAESVRTGLPGVTYIRIDPAVGWPARLQRVVGS